MKPIKFSHNWNNKLGNDIFTTIRNWTPEKESYYKESIGDLFRVELEGKKIREAKLLTISVKEYIEIDATLLQLDTGMIDLDKIQKLFINFGMKDYLSEMIILTFVKPKVTE